MKSEETQIEGIASLIAILELMLPTSQVIITGCSWCTVLFSPLLGHWTHSWPFLMAAGTAVCSKRDDKPHASHEGGWGGTLCMTTQPSGHCDCCHSGITFW